MPPFIPARTKVFMLSEELIKKHTGTQNLAALTYLNLHGNAIRRIEGLQDLVNLKTLVLSFNEIAKIEGLAELQSLERLELGFNLIKRLEGVRGLTALKHLELNNNLLYRLEDLNALKKYTPGLTHLNLRTNAICDNKSYRGIVLRRLMQLDVLDGVVVTEEDRVRAAENSSLLTAQLIQDNAFTRRRGTWSAVNAAAGAASTEDGAAGSSKAEEEDWWVQVEELVLEHQRVRRLQNLDKLVRMRRASFCDNELSRIEGLDACTSLEELSLEDNRLLAIEGLTDLTNLKKLDLGKNKITKCENLSQLTCLTQLSLEDNEITSLQGLMELNSLMELYIGNNRISQLREAQHVKSLPKLIIMDLLGNPLCQEEDYRYYIIYHLRKLKVLDGLGIEAAEQATAKSKYAGRLTRDFLEEKVGHRFFEHLRELDLSAMRVRDLGQVFLGEEFVQLRELNLDSNNLTDVSGLAHLAHLTVLRLNSNRIESAPLVSDNAASTRGGGGGGGVAGERRDAAEESSDSDDDSRKHRGEGGGGHFRSLEVLQLGANNINYVPALQLWHLKNLKILFLQDNDIIKLEGIEGLVNLEELVLDRNKIKHLDAHSFSGLVNLRELRLEENGLRSLSHLSALVRLQSLHLTCNRISEVAELEKLGAHPELVEITLSNNPVSRKQVYRPMLLRCCPALKYLDGRTVTIEEREHVEQLFTPVEQQPMGNIVTITSAAGQPTAKVPIKLTSMNFEALIAPPGPAPSVAALGGLELGLGVAPLPVAKGEAIVRDRRPSSHERAVDAKSAAGASAAGASSIGGTRAGRVAGNVLRSYYRNAL